MYLDLILNDNNHFCHNIIIYNFDIFIDIVILQIPIKKLSLSSYLSYSKFQLE